MDMDEAPESKQEESQEYSDVDQRGGIMNKNIEWYVGELAKSEKAIIDLLGKVKDYEAEVAELQEDLSHWMDANADETMQENVRLKAEVAELLKLKEYAENKALKYMAEVADLTKDKLNAENEIVKLCGELKDIKVYEAKFMRVLDALKDIKNYKEKLFCSSVAKMKNIALKAMAKEGCK